MTDDCPPERLIRIEAPHYTAGICVEQTEEGWVVMDAAPILGWTIGRRVHEVVDYCIRKRFTVRAAPTWRKISRD